MEKASDILKQILFGGTLEDKFSGAGLGLPEIEWDLGAVKLNLPELPGRDGVLKPQMDSDASKRIRFPKRSELKKESARATLLHYFSNHELLALEGMAAALLQFPQVPIEFQKGMMKIIQDEQRHFRMYITRMQDFGMGLGEVPLNLYFWNMLKDLKSPLDFVTRIALTFEQANLDFALEYSEIFEKDLADEKTTQILLKVHDDEVGHVAHGLKWFRTWKPTGESDWDAYQRLLAFPLTPRRARGAHFFSVVSREKAGLTPDFIARVKIAGGSRGRVPDYFFFNPQCEVEYGFQTLPATLRDKVQDLAPLILWLAQEDDVVELPFQPALGWLTELHCWKKELPEIVVEGADISRHVAFEEMRPWGWGEGAWKKFEMMRPKVRRPPAFSSGAHVEKFFSKAWWKDQLRGSEEMTGLSSVILRAEYSKKYTVQNLELWLEAQPSGTDFLLKTSMSTSGRGHLRVAESSLRGHVGEWIDQMQVRLKQDSVLVLEPFLNKKADFSVQYEILSNGTVKSWEPRLFLTDSRFQYQGTILGHPAQIDGLSPAWTTLFRNKSWIDGIHASVLKILSNEKYVGPVGIDALIYSTVEDSEWKVNPIVEVNVRYTMGRVAQEIEKVLKPKMGKEAAIWLMVHRRQIERMGFGSFPLWKENLERRYGKGKVIATSPMQRTSELEVETWTVAILGNSAVRDYSCGLSAT